MTLFIFDTDHMSLYERGHPAVLRNFIHHANDQVVASVTTVEEQLGGWQTALRVAKDDIGREQVYRRMAQAVECLSGWSVLPQTVYTTATSCVASDELNVGSNDLKIAALALEANGIVVTRNRRDFCRVPGPIVEDWSV